MCCNLDGGYIECRRISSDGTTYPEKCDEVNFCKTVCSAWDSYSTIEEDCEPTLCALEELYGEHAEETELLRYLRDNILSQTPEGRELIKLYYQYSPAISEIMEADEEFKEEVKVMIDGVLDLIGAVE